MGSHPNITATLFPRQGSMKGQRVEVVFHHDATNVVTGIVVRDDVQSPFVVLIALDDGRFVEAGECQYTTVTDADADADRATSSDPPHRRDMP